MCGNKVEYVSKTQHYLRVKKPLLERQRRARVNKCLDALKTLVAEFQGDDAILRLDKAEMLEATIEFMRSHDQRTVSDRVLQDKVLPAFDGYRNGYMNAVNEVSRVMASTPGMSVTVGKTVMTHLGVEFNRLLNCRLPTGEATTSIAPLSPASSGYHSDCETEHSSPPSSPPLNTHNLVWRPW